MRELEYPFDAQYILKKRKFIRKSLFSSDTKRLHKKIAVLGGSTTDTVKDMLELFLLNYGIEPEFYQSAYAKYWEEIMFDSSKLRTFEPDVIYIHTTGRNILQYPNLKDSKEKIMELLDQQYAFFSKMWKEIERTYHCVVIQNNFETPSYRLLGNRDIWDIHGRSYFVHQLNDRFYHYAQTHKNFYVNDINYLAAGYGLSDWSDPFYWHMYKCCPAIPAVPELAFNIANIIKSVYGKNKKAIVLDLDHTIWGGVVGDDGADTIEIGQETPVGQMYAEFQKYLKAMKEIGVLLTVDSKNEAENALKGLRREENPLKPEDFVIIKANWEPKDQNLIQIAEELNLGTDSMVFVDDDPAERYRVRRQVSDAAVPEMNAAERYIQIMDRSGFFEMTEISEDDLMRSDMYQADQNRKKQKAFFNSYEDYLKSLDMHAEIGAFIPMYLPRIAQLINKSNQFNLTALRYTAAQIEEYASDSNYITLYGRLNDRFGDNGVVSVVIGHKERRAFHIDLWLMSCRVLKRNVELAMLDALACRCLSCGIRCLYGYYNKTPKNGMVKDFYGEQGFEKISEDNHGNSVWKLEIAGGWKKMNTVIKVTDKQGEGNCEFVYV